MNLCKECNYPLRAKGINCPNCYTTVNSAKIKDKVISPISATDIESGELVFDISSHFGYEIYRKKIKLLNSKKGVYIVRKLNEGDIIKDNDLIISSDKKIMIIKINNKK